MMWAKPIQERWARRGQQIKAAKDKEVKKALGKLDGYTIICTNLGSTKEWYLMKNGKILPPKEYPELYRQLDKCKDGLSKDRYRVEEIKVIKNEVPLSLIFGGPLGLLGNAGKIGQGIDAIRKGLGIIKVGQSIVNQIQSAPSLNATKELEVNDEGKTVEEILKDSKDTTRPKGKAKNYEKSGGMDQAVDDFKSLKPKKSKEISTKYGDGLYGVLEDGTIISVRPGSETGGATLEIKIPGKAIKKIRY